MPKINLLVSFLAALIPMVTGSIWYNPKIGFGNAWIKSTGLTEDELKKANMAVVLGVSFVFSFILATALHPMVIHQFGVMSTLLGPDLEKPGTELNTYYVDFMNKYGNNYRTFKHGALHGTIAGLFLAMPIIGTVALFERKGFKYIALHTGYWMLTLALMGGVICQFSK